ncbi:hypothetical protein ACFXPS_38655 [Nocardia sp. NPDC059091]|uniref:hypothetical protein n=1 Tax=unclassified Nocardia TaxID=2637762 RepID=UPI0036C801E9
MPGEVLAGAEKTAVAVGKAVAKVGKVAVTGTEHAARPLLARFSTALGGLIVLAVLAFVVLRWLPGLPGLPSLGTADPVDSLPATLRAAVSCPGSASINADQCVIPARASLLAGGLSGGRDLTLSIRVVEQDKLGDDIRRWRAAGPSIRSDSAVFAAIGPRFVVWYADVRSGLRIETAAFNDQSAARTFLQRAGLSG